MDHSCFAVRLSNASFSVALNHDIAVVLKNAAICVCYVTMANGNFRMLTGLQERTPVSCTFVCIWSESRASGHAMHILCLSRGDNRFILCKETPTLSSCQQGAVAPFDT